MILYLDDADIIPADPFYFTNGTNDIPRADFLCLPSAKIQLHHILAQFLPFFLFLRFRSSQLSQCLSVRNNSFKLTAVMKLQCIPQIFFQLLKAEIIIL